MGWVVGVALELVGQFVGMSWHETGQVDFVHRNEQLGHDRARADDEPMAWLAHAPYRHRRLRLTLVREVGRITDDHVEELVQLLADIERRLVVVVDKVGAVEAGKAFVELEQFDVDALADLLESSHVPVVTLDVEMVVQGSEKCGTRDACDVELGVIGVRASSVFMSR